jgi:hypothetical protein
MRKYLEALQQAATWHQNDSTFTEVGRIVRERDVEALKKITVARNYSGWWTHEMLSELPGLADLDALDALVLGVIAKIGSGWGLKRYIAENLESEPPEADLFPHLVDHMAAVGLDHDFIVDLAAEAPKALANGALNSAGRWVVGQRDLAKWYPKVVYRFEDLETLVAHLGQTDPQRLVKLAKVLATDENREVWDPAKRPAGWLLRHGGDEMLRVLAKFLPKTTGRTRVHLGLALAEVDADRWRDQVLPTALEVGVKIRRDWPKWGRALMRELARLYGAAANEAMVAAATRRGITVDELGDRVVPWLGFEPGQPRKLDCEDRDIELRIGLDSKLRYFDAAKNKTVKSLPKAAGKELKAQMKQLGATLRSAMKTQRLRHERMLVTQRRWPTARWLELYVAHPVLAPYAVNLVWAGFDAEGRLCSTFRMLEDRSFTDAEDEEPSGPNDPRLLSFGDVPAIVYSETVADLKMISGHANGSEVE